jgi:hypothetical protein
MRKEIQKNRRMLNIECRMSKWKCREMRNENEKIFNYQRL